MDIETITKLIDAGYTKEEIARYESGTESTGAGNEGGENEQPDNANKGEESANEVKTDNVSEILKTLTDTVNGLTATVKAMQDANAGKAHTDTPKAGDAIKAAMDSFIEKL